MVNNGHRKEALQCVEGIGGDEKQVGYDVEATSQLVEDTNWTKEPIQSMPLMCTPVPVEDSRSYSDAIVNNDFDVGSFEQDKWEQKEEDKIVDHDTTNLECSDEEEGDLDGDDHVEGMGVEGMDGDDVEDSSEDEEMLFAAPV